MELYQGPLTLPGSLRFRTDAERQTSRSILWFVQRASSLLQAAGLVDAADEPGLVLPEDRAEAQKYGKLAAEQLPRTSTCGKVQIGYLRTITQNGMTVADLNLNTVTVLEDQCGLGNDYLCAFALAALEKGHRVLLCPSLLNANKLEAVLLPELGMVWISSRLGVKGTIVPLDAIPDPERRLALREALRRDHELQNTLIHQAENQMQMAGILYRVME